MARKKKTEAPVAAMGGAAGGTAGSRSEAVVADGVSIQNKCADASMPSGGSVVGNGRAEAGAGQEKGVSLKIGTSSAVERDASQKEKKLVGGTVSEDDSAEASNETQQQSKQQGTGGTTRTDMQQLSASQRKNLKKKLRKQEQRQQEAAVLAAVRGDDAAAAALCGGTLLGGEGDGTGASIGEPSGVVAGGAGRVLAGGRATAAGIAALYAEKEQKLRKRLEALKSKRFPTGIGGQSQSLNSGPAGGAISGGDKKEGGGGGGSGGRRAVAAEIESLKLEVDALLEQEEASLRKPVRKRIGVQQLQQQVRDMEQQIQKQHKDVQRKTAAAASAQQVLQQREAAAAVSGSSSNSSSHAAATAAAKAQELEAERIRLDESLRYIAHLREQLLLTQQQQEFRNFYDRMQVFKSDCAAFLRSMSNAMQGGSGKAGGGAAGGAGAGGYRAGGNAGGSGGSGGGMPGGAYRGGATPEGAGMLASGGITSNGGSATTAGYSPAKEAQWRRRLQELTHSSGVPRSSSVFSPSASTQQQQQRAGAYLEGNGSTSCVGGTPPANSSRAKSSKPNAAAGNGEETGGSKGSGPISSGAGAVGGGDSSPSMAGVAAAQISATSPLVLQTVSLGADAMSLVFPGAATAGGGSSGPSKLPLVRKIERIHQVVLEKQQGGGGRAGTVLVIGLHATAARQCAASLAALEESMQPEGRSKYRIEVAQGCSIGSVIGLRGGKLRKLEEECGVVVWAEGTEFLVIASTPAAIQKGLQRLKELMTSPQAGGGGGNVEGGNGSQAGTSSMTVTLPVTIAKACASSALRPTIRGIESACGCNIRVVRGGADGVVLVNAADAAAAAAGVKALEEATALLQIRCVPAEPEKVLRLLKSQSCPAFNAAARERSGVACLRGEEGLLLVGPASESVLDDAQQAAEEGLQQISRVVESMVFTPDQMRTLTRAERSVIEEKTGITFRIPHAGTASNSSGGAAGRQGRRRGSARGGGAGGETGGAVASEKGKVTVSLVGRSDEVQQAREMIEEVLREKGYQEIVETCRELTAALLAERGAGVRKLEDFYKVSVSIEKQERRVVVRGSRDRVQECAAELRERQQQMLQQQSNNNYSSGGEGAATVEGMGTNVIHGQKDLRDGEAELGGDGSSNGVLPAIVVQKVPIRRSQVAAFIGKQGTHIKGLQAASGVDSMRVEEADGAVVIRGNSQAVAKAVQLVTDALAAGSNTDNGAGGAAQGGGGNMQQQQEQQQHNKRGSHIETLGGMGGGGSGSTGTRRYSSGVTPQEQLNGDLATPVSGSGGGGFRSGRRGKGRQGDQTQQFTGRRNYGTSGGRGMGGSSNFGNRRGSGVGYRGSRRAGGGGGFATAGGRGSPTAGGGLRNSRYNEQQQLKQSQAPPVSMDASDETAFPSLEDATGAAMLYDRKYGNAVGARGYGIGSKQTNNSTDKEATRRRSVSHNRGEVDDEEETAAVVAAPSPDEDERCNSSVVDDDCGSVAIEEEKGPETAERDIADTQEHNTQEDAWEDDMDAPHKRVEEQVHDNNCGLPEAEGEYEQQEQQDNVKVDDGLVYGPDDAEANRKGRGGGVALEEAQLEGKYHTDTSSSVLLFSSNSSEAPTAAAHLNGSCCDPTLLREEATVTLEGAVCPAVAAAAQHHCVPCGTTSSAPEEEVF